MVVALLLSLFATAAPLPPPPSELPVAQQERLARYFAPTLVYHPDEPFFPVSPVTPGATSGDIPSGAADIEPIDVRIARYLGLERSAKLALGTVFYRVTIRLEEGRRRIGLEYFFYYLGNPYWSHGGVLPIPLNLWHPHDLEHALFVVDFPMDTDLMTARPEQGHIVAVYPSAHGDAMPDNILHATGPLGLAVPVRLLVELGSHAMAVDANGDGLFTPRLDADGPHKFTWGIRDHGTPWAWYQTSDMDARQSDAVVLGGSTYRLAPATEMTAAFEALTRSASFVKESGRASWAVRSFGEAAADELLAVPPLERDPDAAYGARAAARWEGKLTVGVSNLLSHYGFAEGGRNVLRHFSLLAGGRWVFATPSLLPDVMVDAEGVLTYDGRVYSVVDVLATYRLDFVTRLFVGGGPVIQWWSLTRHEVEWDWVAGLEFHFGRLRVWPAVRRIDGLEVRISYAF
jgi:hypothetical protein